MMSNWYNPLFLFHLVVVSAIAETQVIPVPTTLNQQFVGQLNAEVDGEQLIRLDISALKRHLSDVLRAEQLLKLGTNNMVTPADLSLAGIQTTFDFQALSVRLSVPTELKPLQTIDLLGIPRKHAGALRPSGFSAYMNLRGGFDYVEGSHTSQPGINQPQLAVENAFNWHGVVLDNEVDVYPDENQTWQKRDTRLIYDQPAERLRWTLGDLNYSVAGFQGFIPIVGLSLNRENSLQPYRITSPLGHSSFVLKEDSKVEVLINGRTVQTLQLSAGPHEISNFPLSGGANDVQLRITDPVGRIEYIQSTLFYDPGLLKEGESAFNCAIGFPSQLVADDPIYQYTVQPTLSTFYRAGVTDKVTAGANVQATENTQMGGAEAVVSTMVGTFGVDSALSYDHALGSGFAERFQYHYYAPHESLFADGNLGVSLEYQSARFSLPNPFAVSLFRQDSWLGQASYSQRLTKRLSGGLTYMRQLGDASRETYSISSGYNWGRVRSNIGVAHSLGGGAHREWTAFISFTVNLGGGHTISSTFDSGTQTGREEWQYCAPKYANGFDSIVGIQESPGASDAYGSIHYAGSREDVLLTQDVMDNGDSVSGFRFGAALVFADGEFAISRPIVDSFAVIDSSGSLAQDGGVGVQPQGHGFVTKEDWLGPAVMPQLQAYYPSHLTVVPLNPHADFDPQSGDIYMSPTYHSGTRIRLAHEATINITATFVWAGGKKAALQDGTLKRADGSVAEFVSDLDGFVWIGDLIAGTYQVTLLSHPKISFPIVVPPTKEREINIGEIKVPVEE